MVKPLFQSPMARAAGLAGLLILLFLLIYVLSPVFVPLFFALIVAYALHPLVVFFEARKIPRGFTVGALGVLGILAVLCIPVFVIPGLISEANQLISGPGLPVGVGQAERLGGLAGLGQRLLDALPLDTLVQALGWAPEQGEEFDAMGILRAKVGMYVKIHAVQLLQTYAPQIVGAGQQAGWTLAELFAGIGRSLVGLVVFLGNFALFAFVAGYVLKDFDGLIEATKDLVPPKWRPKTFELAAKVDAQFRAFLRGQMLVCLSLGVMYALGLSFCRVPFATVIAASGAVVSFVPYLGLILALGPALGLAMLQHGLDWHVIGVVITFAVAQFIEGAVLTPRVVGEQVGLHPVWIIVAVLVFGTLLGFVGLLVAVPAAAVLKVLVLEAVGYYKRSPVFEGLDSGRGGSAGDAAA